MFKLVAGLHPGMLHLPGVKDKKFSERLPFFCLQDYLE
jgi:hypothetical protein